MKEEKTDTSKLLIYVLSIVCTVSIFVLVVYIVFNREDSNEKKLTKPINYFSKKESVIVINKTDKELDRYLFYEPELIKNVNTYSMDVRGFNELLDESRSGLKKALGENLYKKYVENHASKVLNVRDNGNTLRVDVVDGYSMIINPSDGKLSSYYDENEQEREEQNLVKGLTYLYKDSRNIHIRYGEIGRNKYNKNVFIKSGNEYIFNRDELMKVENWEDYPFKLLLELNEYSESK